VRNLIHDLLEQTGVFDGVYLSGFPEDCGQPSSDCRAVVIAPGETEEAAPWDDAGGDLLFTCCLTLTLLARHEDPHTRDEMVESLLYQAANTLGGNALGGAAIPARTRFRSWTWQKPVPPERRIAAILVYQYLVDGWSGLNTAE
jgi:hypothetical protein